MLYQVKTTYLKTQSKIVDLLVHPEMFLVSLRDTSGEKLVWLPRFWYFTDNSVEAQIQWRFIA